MRLYYFIKEFKEVKVSFFNVLRYYVFFLKYILIIVVIKLVNDMSICGGFYLY